MFAIRARQLHLFPITSAYILFSGVVQGTDETTLIRERTPT